MYLLIDFSANHHHEIEKMCIFVTKFVKYLRISQTIMNKDLTQSNIERQNILNNRFAVENIAKSLDVVGMLFEGEYRFTKQMVAEFYQVDERTIERCIEQNIDELRHNGYILSKGKQLKEFKLQFAHVINVGSKTTQLALFNFRSFINVGMLLTESEKAKQVRSIILDIVIGSINEKVGGGTKFINRRDVNYLSAAVTEENYRKTLTSAINHCVSGHPNYKYSQVTDLIYKAIFRENAKEYREILKLNSKDNIRHTLYAEVLLVVSSFENGVGFQIEKMFQNRGNVQLSIEEVGQIVKQLADEPSQQPYLNDARTKMASRDYGFRDAYHGNIAEYLKAITPEEFERFIGSESIDFDQILEDNKDVLKRLKQAENDR